MEIPLELMLTISKKLPWMFFPDIVPVGHPIFDIINSTNPEVMVHFLSQKAHIKLGGYPSVFPLSSFCFFVSLSIYAGPFFVKKEN